jgi:hypothetical protein
MPTGAIIGGIGSVVSAGASAFGANSAANAQRDAAMQGNALLQGQYNQNSANLAPWMTGGARSFDTINRLTGNFEGGDPMTAELTRKFQPTMEELAKTPGYQFTLDQGLKSTQNSYASKGLGSSGAAMKGAADYAGGLASNTYQQQFQNYWNQNKSIYDMLTGQSTAGLQAAGMLANNGTTLAQGQSNNLVGAGNARAASYNTMGSAFGNAAQGIAGYGLLSNYLSNGTPNAPWAGGGAAFGGNGVWGGSSQNPLEGLSPSDYGAGY